MRRMLTFLGLTVLLVCSISRSALADTTYNYSGPKFDTFTDPSNQLPAGVTGLSGWLKLSGPLGPNFDGSVTPLSFSFTDGATTINNLNAAGFTANFITDGTSNMIGWSLQGWIETPGADWIEVNFFINGPSVQRSDDQVSYVNANGTIYASTNAVGTWSTPEPSTSMLLGLGISALACVSWRLRPYLRGRGN